MTQSQHPHGPENAEHEIKKAYNTWVETGVVFGWDRPRKIGSVDPAEVGRCYKQAYKAYRDEDRLSAERWARACKHLARAFWHEAKIEFLEPRASQFPFLENAREEYNLHEYSDTTEDLIHSLEGHVPPGMEEMPEEMNRYASRARWHLELLQRPELKHELVRAEHIKAAHEYGRVLECMALAYEAEIAHQKRKSAGGEAA